MRWAVFAQPFAIPQRAEQTAHLFADRPHQVHGRPWPFPFGPQLFQHRKHNRERCLGVDRPPAVDPAIDDLAIKGVARHVFDADGVEVGIDANRMIGFTLEPGVHVAPPIEDFVDHHISTSSVTHVGQPGRQRTLAIGSRNRPSLQRIHTWNPHQVSHPLTNRTTQNQPPVDSPPT